MLHACLESHTQCLSTPRIRVMRIMDEVKAAPEIVALGDFEVVCKSTGFGIPIRDGPYLH